MQLVVTIATMEQEPFVGAIVLMGVATLRASLRGVLRLHFDRQRSSQGRFIGDQGMQFGKGPLRADPVGTRSSFDYFPTLTVGNRGVSLRVL